MWYAIFTFAALASPLILLALAVGAAGPIVKIKVRLGLIAFMVLITSIVLILRDIMTGHHPFKAKKGT